MWYTLSEAWSGVNRADLMAAQGAFGTDFYDKSTRTIVGNIRPIHSAPSLGQSIDWLKLKCWPYPTSVAIAALPLSLISIFQETKWPPSSVMWGEMSLWYIRMTNVRLPWWRIYKHWSIPSSIYTLWFDTPYLFLRKSAPYGTLSHDTHLIDSFYNYFNLDGSFVKSVNRVLLQHIKVLTTKGNSNGRFHTTLIWSWTTRIVRYLLAV